MNPSALFDAVERNQISRVRDLLQTPLTDVNWSDPKGWTALHLACGDGYPESVKLLLAHPLINPDKRNSSGGTPLMVAAFTDHVDVVQLLLADERIDVNPTDKQGATPLWEAAYWGFLHIVKAFIACGRHLQLDLQTVAGNDDWNNTTALDIATRKKNHKVVGLLQRFQAEPATTRHEVWLELSRQDGLVAELFALMVFFCDDFLEVEEEVKGQRQGRFFRISAKLPQELQMVLSNRVYGSRGTGVLLRNSESAFRKLAGMWAPR